MYNHNVHAHPCSKRSFVLLCQLREVLLINETTPRPLLSHALAPTATVRLQYSLRSIHINVSAARASHPAYLIEAVPCTTTIFQLRSNRAAIPLMHERLANVRRQVSQRPCAAVVVQAEDQRRRLRDHCL